jgi:hypothetical protein
MRSGTSSRLVLALLATAAGGCLSHAGRNGAASPAAAANEATGAAKAGGAAAAAGTTGTPAPVIWELAWMTRVKRELAGDPRYAPALARLRQEADRALTAGPFSVMNKKLVPPSGDKHDYMSVAPYWWPDPSKPDGLPYIRKDGERNPARNNGDTDNAAESAMAAAVETLGLAFFFTDHAPYAQHAVKLLRAWFIDPATRMNPNLSYAQGILGVTAGRAAGVIDTIDLVPLLESVELLRASPAYTEADDRALRAWFAGYLDWLSTSEIGRAEKAATNNHGSWYDVQVARFALFVGRTDLARVVAGDARQIRIAAQIQPDGSQPRELSRTRSFHYSFFNLSALFSLGTIGQKLNVDLHHFYTPTGASLRKALDYLLPYLDPAATWPHQQLGGRDSATAIPVLLRARRVYEDPRYEAALTRHLAGELRDNRALLLIP